MSKIDQIRLDKYIATYSDYSRSDVRHYAKQGEITVNDEVVVDSSTKIDVNSLVSVVGQVVAPIRDLIIMLHKPLDVVCANKDGNHPTVIDLVGDQANCLTKDFNPSKQLICQLQIAGRLDIDTTGLVLLTNNGDWNHRITSPNFVCEKRYRVTLATPLKEEYLTYFEEGILLRGETKKTRPATLIPRTPHECDLIISEGKYHQVKRMFSALGNRVIQLHRDKIGALRLDPTLEVGQFRLLGASEINHLITRS